MSLAPRSGVADHSGLSPAACSLPVCALSAAVESGELPHHWSWPRNASPLETCDAWCVRCRPPRSVILFSPRLPCIVNRKCLPSLVPSRRWTRLDVSRGLPLCIRFLSLLQRAAPLSVFFFSRSRTNCAFRASAQLLALSRLSIPGESITRDALSGRRGATFS